jgi:hypothetical protein
MKTVVLHITVENYDELFKMLMKSENVVDFELTGEFDDEKPEDEDVSTNYEVG